MSESNLTIDEKEFLGNSICGLDIEEHDGVKCLCKNGEKFCELDEFKPDDPETEEEAEQLNLVLESYENTKGINQDWRKSKDHLDRLSTMTRKPGILINEILKDTGFNAS